MQVRKRGKMLQLDKEHLFKKETRNQLQLMSYLINTECFLPNMENKARMSALTIHTQHSTRSPSHCNKARKEKVLR